MSNCTEHGHTWEMVLDNSKSVFPETGTPCKCGKIRWSVIDIPKPKKFDRVDLEDELRANADGMPVFRKCFEHEILLSFYDDDGAYGFRDWWYEEGSAVFYKYMEKEERL